MGIFDLNLDAKVIKESFMGSNLYYIDNFYKYPDEVADLLNKVPNMRFESYSPASAPNYNGVYFDDRRVLLKTDEMLCVWKLLSQIIGGILPDWPHGRCQDVVTNHFRFIDKNYVQCKDYYWHPHYDVGYTALVYLNKNDDICGTNLYKPIQPDLPKSRGEHVDPWRSKKNWEKITTLKPAFNRCVIFDGSKFAHGMNVVDGMYCGEEFRINQVFFFKNEKGSSSEPPT